MTSGCLAWRRVTSESATLRAEGEMSGRRPRLLFATYTFPPARVAGTVRVWNVAKYLARSGWAVTVLTPDPSLWRYVEREAETEIELQREGISRLPANHRWRWLAGNSVKCADGKLASFLGAASRKVAHRLGADRTLGWVKPAQRACSHLRPGDVDLVLASGPPFSAFALARRLSDRLRCPYVLDYRDMWSRNHFHPAPRAVRKEAALLGGSAAVTTVSPSWSSVMDRQFGVGRKLHVISNGYDAEELAAVAPQEFDHFAIVYAGALTPPKQTILPVMAALRRLAEATHGLASQWKFHYYGSSARHVVEQAARFQVTDMVVVHGRVPRHQALSAVKGAGVAVVITSTVEQATPEDNGVVTGKIFESIGLRTPTLLVAPADSDAHAVAEITGLVRGYSPTDVDGIAAFLRDMVNGHTLEPKDPVAYAWENLVAGFDRILRNVVRG
jgi:glycosyltransferase involved in cell wall biosynthesis